ncbi:MAG: translation initiation factor IF-2 [Polyangiaceae bacterium]|nr:translation initiation factor IF-2 [Polyangiaceae bacterium]
MSKVRVYEVAKQLNMDQKTLVALFQSMGVGDVRNHMSAVEQDVVERVKRHLERQKAPEVVEERIRPTVVKRRARSGEGIPEARPSEPHAHIPAPAPSSPGVTQPVVRHVPPAPPSAPAFRAPPPPPSRPEAPVARRIPEPPPSVEAFTPPPKVVEVPAARPSRPEIPPPRASEPKREPPPVVEVKAPPAEPVVVAPVAAPVAPPPVVEAAPAEPPPPAREPEPVKAAPSAPPVVASEPEKAPPPVEKTEAAPAEQAAPEPVRAEPPPVVEAAPEPPPPSPRPLARVEAPPPPPPPPPPQQTHQRAGAQPPIRRAAPAQAQAPAARQTEESQAPKRPSSPPKTGIDVWQGRPGVPMPAAPRSAGTPPARRTTYDPRAAAPAARPQTTFGPQSRGPMGARGRQGGRPGQQPQRGAPGQMQQRGKSAVTTQEMASHKKVVKIEEQVTLQQLAAKMSVKAVDVLMKLLQMGMSGVHINSTLDTDTAKIIASEFGWTVEDVAVSEAATLADATGADVDADEEQGTRPPIVTVMGHVDHGKTSLLDRIRKASVAEGEAGGITQHIGAYRVETLRGTIAFLDTPGHEAFTAMRARGASVTDLVILVVAADDGVMPQTREAINHAQAAKVPIIVAINKIDKPGAEPEKIKRDLANLGLQPEEWGGDTMFAHVSAKTGVGIDQLLEAVLLQAEVLELKANAKKRASGTVIEALLDRGRGPVARVMVQDGTLHVGDILLAGGAWGKVRAMTDELGRAVGEAGPSTPVEVLGLNEVPSAGDPVHSVKDGKTAEEIAETRRKKASKTLLPLDSRVSLEALTKSLAESEQLELKLIIKGDVQGSVEAVVHALTKLSTPKVKVTVVHAAVGGITEGDVNLAVASKAIIVGFNVRPAGKAASHAETEGVEIRLYNIIYNAVDDIRSAMEGLLPATKVEKILGRAEIRQIFRIVKVGNVAGCMVLSGLMRRTADARLIRDSVVVWTGKLSALRRFKDDAKEVAEGFECGISLENYQDMKDGDIVECFEVEEIKTKLS